MYKKISLKKLFTIILLGFIIFIISITSSLYYFANKAPIIDFNTTERNLNPNTTKYYNFNGIIVLDLFSDTPYINGYFHGEKLKNEINNLLTYFNTKIIKKDILNIQKTLINYKIKDYIKYIKPEYLQEIKGIADGANVSVNDILLINIYDELMNNSGCSSLVIPKGEAEVFYHARNLDYNIPILAKTKVLFKYKDYVTVGFPGYIGGITGVNYNGISLSSHTTYSKEKNKIGTPSGFIYKNILENSKTINDVENILKNSNISISNNLAVGSEKENRAVVFEFDTKDLELRENKNNYIVTANHYISDKMKTKSTKELTNSIKRYNQYINHISKMGILGLNNIKKIMSYYDKSIKGWGTIANNGTVQSVIINSSDKVIYIAKGEKTPVTDGGYETILY